MIIIMMVMMIMTMTMIMMIRMTQDGNSPTLRKEIKTQRIYELTKMRMSDVSGDG